MLATSRLRKKIVRVPGGWVGAREHEGLLGRFGALRESLRVLMVKLLIELFNGL